MNNEPTIDSGAKVMLWLVASAMTTVLVLVWLCGCANHVTTNQVPTLPTQPQASFVKEVLITPPTTNPFPSIRLTWDENYMAGLTNEQTAIEETTDFVNWATVFTGSTNECWVPETTSYGFFRAYNFLP